MPAAEHWKMYSLDFDGRPGSCIINIALADSLPDKKRPVCLMARVSFRNAGMDGWGTAEERHALAAIEDVVFGQLRKQLNVASVRGYGVLDDWLYAPKNAAQNALDAMRDSFHGYEIEGASSDDPEWTQHTDVLFPDKAAMRAIGNLDVIAAMQQAGDPMVHPRPVVLSSLFSDEQNAKHFAAASEALGSIVQSIEESDESDPPWMVETVTISTLTPELIDGLIGAVEHLKDPHSGLYDGWQAVFLDKDGDSTMDRARR